MHCRTKVVAFIPINIATKPLSLIFESLTVQTTNKYEGLITPIGDDEIFENSGVLSVETRNLSDA